MKIRKASLVILANLTFAAILCAQAKYEGELTAIEDRYQTSLEQLMQRATQNEDLNTALKVSEKLAALKAREEPAESAADDTAPLIGRWLHKSSSGFTGEDEFFPDGKFRGAGRYGTWKKVGSRIETSVETPRGEYLDYYKLPVRDGKLYGTNKNGTFSIVLTKIPTGAAGAAIPEQLFVGTAWKTSYGTTFAFQENQRGIRTFGDEDQTAFNWKCLPDGLVEVRGPFQKGGLEVTWYFRFVEKKEAFYGPHTNAVNRPLSKVK